MLRPEVPLPEAGVRWALSQYVEHRDDEVVRRIEQAAQAAADPTDAVDEASRIAHRFAIGPRGRWPSQVPRFGHPQEAVDALEAHTVGRVLGEESISEADYLRAAQIIVARVAATHGADPVLAALQHAHLGHQAQRASDDDESSGRIRTRRFWREHDVDIVGRTPFEELIQARNNRVLTEWVGRIFRAAVWSLPDDPIVRRLQQCATAEKGVAAFLPMTGPELDEYRSQEWSIRAQTLIEDCYPLYRKVAPLGPAVSAFNPLLRELAESIPRVRAAQQALQHWTEKEAVRCRAIAEGRLPRCDWCGMPVGSGEKHTATVCDSSFADPRGPAGDGQRLITACAADHLSVLRKHYAERPFFEHEVRTAKLARAYHQHPSGLTGRQLGEHTGMSDEELETSVVWHNGAERRLFYQAHLFCARNDPSFIRRDFKISFIPDI